ncbi:MAG: SDR family oxidoreductase [Chloroflexi bacterium]|nr:SDR family oxidoreductase [Chloroflexota bacterium]
MNRFSLDGKIALVTGASQGIGRAIAIALAEAGATVVVSDLAEKSAPASAVCEEIANSGGSAFRRELDVTNESQIAETFEGVVEAHGRLDILVNNSGIARHGPALDITPDDWDRVMNVNLRGMFFCAQAAARYIIDGGGGRIINIASQRAVSASANNAPYIASKAGAAGLTRALALEWVKHGITVNAIGPGPVETDMVAGLGPEAEQAVISRSPIGRRLVPDDISGAAVFLASPAAASINGQLLMVDGGWTAA